MSVKDIGNALNINSKWARNLPSLIYFTRVINRIPPPNPNIKVVYRYGLRHISGEQRGAGDYA
jgi:hypothetical protein